MNRIRCWFLNGHTRLLSALFVWVAGLSAGFAALQIYMVTPGSNGSAPADLPNTKLCEDTQGRARLMMFVHPHCPCSRASLDELQKAIAVSSELVTVEVLLVKPAEVEAGWEQGVSAKAAAAIPGIRVRCDDGGLLARHYGAATSGHVVYFDRDGKLRFHGGLTRSRGHAGDNAGVRAITALLQGQPAETSNTPVYGCSLIRACERHVSGAACGSQSETRLLP